MAVEPFLQMSLRLLFVRFRVLTTTSKRSQRSSRKLTLTGMVKSTIPNSLWPLWTRTAFYPVSVSRLLSVCLILMETVKSLSLSC